jgi:hypothetical protein
MSDLYVFSIGPFLVLDGSGTFYFGLHEGRLLPSPQAEGAGPAMAALAREVPHGTPLRCTPELASEGAALGYVGQAPSEEARFVRAQLALVVAHGADAPRCGAELRPLLLAAGDFWRTRAWERVPADEGLEVTVSGALAETLEAAVMGDGGEEFGVILYTKPGSVAKLADLVERGKVREARKLDFMSVSLEDDLPATVEAVQALCGLPRVPMLMALRNGKRHPLDGPDALVLAGVLQAVVACTGARGEVHTFDVGSAEAPLRVSLRVPPATASVTVVREAEAERVLQLFPGLQGAPGAETPKARGRSRR